MATGLGCETLQRSQEMENFLPLLIAAIELCSGYDISRKLSEVVADFHLGLT